MKAREVRSPSRNEGLAEAAGDRLPRGGAGDVPRCGEVHIVIRRCAERVAIALNAQRPTVSLTYRSCPFADRRWRCGSTNASDQFSTAWCQAAYVTNQP